MVAKRAEELKQRALPAEKWVRWHNRMNVSPGSWRWRDIPGGESKGEGVIVDFGVRQNYVRGGFVGKKRHLMDRLSAFLSGWHVPGSDTDRLQW